ncbi:putative GTP diphosphokinase RSH1, chloroplastic isoform X2 [Tanacetum coccineum]|uniref:GTP diphosphokinase RSH1, chloroplastic isoform X2 n=1 Tax=Tanacetum coccineum TaxID=301880 RepID=A0ABQ4YD58_9ASTR
MESQSEESNDELETSNITTKTKRHDETDERTSNMNKHLNIHESSTNEEGTMSRKTKVTSDTTEVKSEPDEEFNNTYDNQVIEEKIQRNTRSRKKKLTSDVFEVQRIGLGINRCWSVEDTNLVTFEKIKEQFGATVRHIVEGETKVSKLGKLKYKNESHSVQDVKAHDLRQMFLAMTEEVRVIIVKIADRLHNMRTLSHMDSLINKGRKADLIVINPSSWSMVPIHDCISSLVYCLRSENIDSVNSSDVSGNFTTTDGRKSFSKPIGSEIFQFGVLFAFHKDRAAKKKTAVAFAEVSLGSRQNLIYVDLSNLSFINGCDLGLKGKNVVDFIADELVKKQLSLVFLENVDMTDIVT